MANSLHNKHNEKKISYEKLMSSDIIWGYYIFNFPLFKLGYRIISFSHRVASTLEAIKIIIDEVK